MIDQLYNSVKESYASNSKYRLLKYRIYKMLINLLFPIIYCNYKKNGTEKNSEIIVSLTSFPDRIDTVWMTVVSLLRQTKKPEKVILWLANEQFPGKRIPNSLSRLQKYGLEIRWCDDLKPHKKYFYCMQEYSDKCIVIADDDIFYPESHLQLLWDNYRKHPKCIIANRTRHITFNEDGEIKKYREWDNCITENPSYLLLAIGCNGVLYPPHLLNFDIIFNLNYIEENVLFTDDLWLKICSVDSKIKTLSCIENELVYFDCIRASRVGLWRTNIAGVNRNDSVWAKLMTDYPAVKYQLHEARLDENQCVDEGKRL